MHTCPLTKWPFHELLKLIFPCIGYNRFLIKFSAYVKSTGNSEFESDRSEPLPEGL